jgi:type III pantothenate kinase
MNKQNTLLVDVGNSSVKWRLITVAATKKNPAMLQQQYPKDISKSFFIQCWQTLAKPDKVVVSCVANKHVWQVLEQACEELWSIKAEKITSVKEGFGIINAYKQPSDLGSDRWCAMIGALHAIESDFIVVDCGSAITIDVVMSSGKHHAGKHLGGYILPGFSMMKQSLGMHTAEVQVDIKLSSATLTPSNSTQGCVDSAIYLSVVKLIEAIFEQQEKQDKKAQCVLTGGDAALVAKLLSIKYVMMPELVLHGLAIIADVGLENN